MASNSSRNAYWRAYRARNLARKHEQERSYRAKPAARKRKAVADHAYYVANKARIRRLQRKRHALNPLKERARNRVYYYLRNGTLVKRPCEVCGKRKVQAHHEDYSKPLDVIWLCTTHHGKQHEVN